MRQRTLWILVAVILGVVLGMFALSTTRHEEGKESPEDETGLLYQVIVALGITRRRKR